MCACWPCARHRDSRALLFAPACLISQENIFALDSVLFKKEAIPSGLVLYSDIIYQRGFHILHAFETIMLTRKYFKLLVFNRLSWFPNLFNKRKLSTLVDALSLRLRNDEPFCARNFTAVLDDELDFRTACNKSARCAHVDGQQVSIYVLCLSPSIFLGLRWPFAFVNLVSENLFCPFLASAVRVACGNWA